MSEKLCLTKSEIKAPTRAPMKARQLQFLRQDGIRHYIDRQSLPVVLRTAVGITHPGPVCAKQCRVGAVTQAHVRHAEGDETGRGG